MKIALVELGTSHDECLYSQIKILKAKPGVEVHLLCSQAIYERTKHFQEVDAFYVCTPPKSFFKLQKEYRKLKKHIKKEGFTKLIFNTAQGGEVKKLIPFLRKFKGDIFGTIHDTKKLSKSAGQKIISKKIKGYFVLNHYLEAKLKTQTNKALAAFYPIFFPTVEAADIVKSENEIWFIVPGQLENKRRDYERLFEAVKALNQPNNFKFILLGKSMHKHGNGQWAKDFISRNKLQDNFILWDNFVPHEVCEAYLQQADYLLPLIHPKHPSGELYKHQITGAFNLAFGYKIPLLIEEQFKTYEDFKDNSIFYSLENFGNTLQKGSTPNKSTFFLEEKWTFDFQKNAYWSFIES